MLAVVIAPFSKKTFYARACSGKDTLDSIFYRIENKFGNLINFFGFRFQKKIVKSLLISYPNPL